MSHLALAGSRGKKGRRGGELPGEQRSRGQEGGPVPGQAASFDQRDPLAGEHLRSVRRAERVRLVGQDDDVRPAGGHIVQGDVRVPVGMVRVDVPSPSRAATSPANVSDPTTIQGSRQTGMAARSRGPPRAAAMPGPPRPARPAPASRAPRGTSCAVRPRPRPGSGSRSSRPAPPARGGVPRRAACFLPGWSARCPAAARRWPPGRGSWCRAPVSRPAPRGWVHQVVAPTSAAGRVTAIDSVSDGTSDTTRRAGLVTSTGWPRSSRGHELLTPGTRRMRASPWPPPPHSAAAPTSRRPCGAAPGRGSGPAGRRSCRPGGRERWRRR